jgi:hypothetical protein
MIKEYICHFTYESKKISLIFDIYQNELTELWSSVVEKNIVENQQPINFTNYIDNSFEKIIAYQ